MRYVIILGALPAVAMWIAMPSASPPLKAKAVTPEDIRQQRQDEHSFRLRWSPVADMPPTIETRHEPLLLVSHDPRIEGGAVTSGNAAISGARPSGVARANTEIEGRTVPPSMRRMVALRADICARHGQRKVMVGKYRWRCRR